MIKIYNFAEYYHCMPNVIGDLLTPDAKEIFSKIYLLCGCGNHPSLGASVSELSKWSAMSEQKVKRCIGEIVAMNLVKVIGKPREEKMYIINWGEIRLATKYIYHVDYEGRGMLHKFCNPRKGKFIAFSTLLLDSRGLYNINSALRKYCMEEYKGLGLWFNNDGELYDKNCKIIAERISDNIKH